MIPSAESCFPKAHNTARSCSARLLRGDAESYDLRSCQGNMSRATPRGLDLLSNSVHLYIRQAVAVPRLPSSRSWRRGGVGADPLTLGHWRGIGNGERQRGRPLAAWRVGRIYSFASISLRAAEAALLIASFSSSFSCVSIGTASFAFGPNLPRILTAATATPLSLP